LTLLLFDIDGTLVNAHGLGRRTIEQALGDVVGRRVTARGVDFAGRTDPAIAADMLRGAGVSESDVPGMLSLGLARYTALMTEQDAPVDRLPGVVELLDRLSATPDVSLGLLTGNMEVSAFAKLRMADLDGYFAFGAFGSDDADRYALPGVAASRAAAVLGRAVEAASTVVVGDTAHDVGCGRGAGMRTVAVCTGPVGRDVLRAAAPDLLLEDFRDPTLFYRFLSLG